MNEPFQFIMEELRLGDGHLSALGIVHLSVSNTTKYVKLLRNPTRHRSKPEGKK